MWTNLWKLKRTVWSKGKRSRNKASVGEPADGSLRVYLHTHTHTRITHDARATELSKLLSTITARIASILKLVNQYNIAANTLSTYTHTHTHYLYHATRAVDAVNAITLLKHTYLHTHTYTHTWIAQRLGLRWSVLYCNHVRMYSPRTHALLNVCSVHTLPSEQYTDTLTALRISLRNLQLY